MKNSNKSYISFLAIFVSALVFFCVSPFLFGDTRKVKSDNYDVSIKSNGYVIKVTNARYDTANKLFSFDLFIKEDYATEAVVVPHITEIAESAKLSEPLAYTESKSSEYKTEVTVSGLDPEFYYVRIKITSRTPDVQPPPETDEFGNVITFPVEPGEDVNEYVYIDYRDVAFDKSPEQSATVAQSDADTTTTSLPQTTTTSAVVTTAPEQSATVAQSAVDTTVNSLPQTTVPATTSVVTTAPVVTTTPEQVTTTTAATTKATEKKTTTTTKKVTTTAKPKPVTTTKKVTTTTKKVTTTAKATTTTKKTTTTTKATTTLTPIRLRGLALKTVSADNTVYIKVGESTQVTPVYTPAQATNKKVYWSSNREDRAVVDSNGKVTGRSPGAVIIKCVSDDGGLSAACMIVVVDS